MLILAVLLTCAASCGFLGNDTPRFGESEYRCVKNGCCVYPTGKKFLRAVCQQGEAEVRIDGVRTQKQIGPSEQNYAVRITDQQDNPILVSDNGRMPRHWHMRHHNCHMIKNISEFAREKDVREELMKQVDNNFTTR